MAKSVRTIVKDRGYSHAREQIEALKQNPEVHIGVQGSDAEKLRGQGAKMISVVDIATTHEYGTDRIPERSFIRSTVDQNFNLYLDIVRKLKGEILLNKMTIATGLGLLGEKIKSDIQRKITLGIAPALSETTKKLKTVNGRTGDTPLIDTGQLRASISWVIKERKGGSE